MNSRLTKIYGIRAWLPTSVMGPMSLTPSTKTRLSGHGGPWEHRIPFRPRRPALRLPRSADPHFSPPSDVHRESPFRHLRAGPTPGATGRRAQFPTYFGVQPALLKPPTPAVTRGPDRLNEISRNGVLPTSALVQRRHQLWAFRSDLPRSVATRQGGPSRASNAGRLGLGPSPPTRTR